MLRIYSKNELNDLYLKTPEDIFSGDGNNKTFALYNITPEMMARIFVDESLVQENIDFYTYYEEFAIYYYYGMIMLGTSFVFFYYPPGQGTNNIICQAYSSLFFPYGTVQYGHLNAIRGDLLQLPFYICNDDPQTKLENIIITPTDHFEDDTISMDLKMIKMAATEAGLNTAVAGQAVSLGTITDTNFHEVWVRIEVPGGYISPFIPYLNKYNIAFMVAVKEQGL